MTLDPPESKIADPCLQNIYGTAWVMACITYEISMQGKRGWYNLCSFQPTVQLAVGPMKKI
jgi:hypothetical protein